MTATPTTRHISTARMGLGRAVLIGAAAGVLASLLMAAYAMIGAWATGAGFFTPLYHIASLLIAPNAMMASMYDAQAGAAFHLAFGPAAVGAVIHMATGAVYGAIFAVVVSRFAIRAALVVVAGVVWGALVFAFSTWIGLPAAAAILGAGDPIRNMAQMAGYGTFIIEHLLYGLVLGALVALWGRQGSTTRT
jgi:hypothetical protein